MTRPAIALVTGFTRNAELCRRSLSPLRELKDEGIIDRILNVTWDSAALDEFVAPIAAMRDVELVRLPQPVVTGGTYRKGCTLQLRNLEAALALVPESDALIFKTRPDFLIDVDFLEAKLANFDKHCAPSSLSHSFGVDMPKSPFEKKIWLPWADSNQPFFYEDGAFMGLKRDVAKLADRRAEKYLSDLDNHTYSWLAHIVRFIVPFLDDYPVFERFLRDFHCYPKVFDFRMDMVKTVQEEPFFWYLLVTHAWILATSFHVDCGTEGQMGLYTNLYNQQTDWSKFQTLLPSPPYNDVATWRAGQCSGGVLPGAGRAFGRLMDDDWQHALFTRSELNDLTPDAIREMLRGMRFYSQGVLTEAEDSFYDVLKMLCQKHNIAGIRSDAAA